MALVQKVAQKFLKYYNKGRRLATAPPSPLARPRKMRWQYCGSDHANIDKVELSIAFVGDKVIRRLNKTYRGIDKVTDVLAFPGAAAGTSIGERMFLGEILINYSQVKRQAPQPRQGRGAGQAEKFNNNVKQELIFILIHGLLHLLGYDDSTENGKKEMERTGEEFVSKFKINNAK